MAVLKAELIDAMDDKNAELQTNLTIILRKEDRKLVVLVTELLRAKAIDAEAAKRVLGMEPFPQSHG